MSTSFPILTFHAVDDRPSVISFPPQLFRWGMARLHESRYRTLSLPELAEYLKRGAAFPKRSFVITFDDGYQSVYDDAFPVIQRYGFSATVFLTVGNNGNRTESQRLPSMCERSMLGWHEIREMHRCGIAFGAHTLTHPDLTRLPLDRVEVEVQNSKTIIEDAIGDKVVSFAYPYGCYDDRTREIVSRHFACACSDRLGMVHSGSDAHALERVDAYYLRSEKLLNLISSALFPLYVKARSIPRSIRWGRE